MEGAVGDAPIGGACTRSTDCSTGVCVPSVAGRVCARECSSTSDCRASAATSTCSPFYLDIDGNGSSDRAANACVTPGRGLTPGAACVTPDACATHSCIAGACAESCRSDADCVLGERCASVLLADASDARVSICTHGAPPLSGLETIDLGRITASSSATNPTIAFSIPADATGFAIVGQPERRIPATTLTLVSLTAPSSTQLFNYGQLAMFIDQPIRWTPRENIDFVSVFVPNTTADRVAFESGRYAAVFGAYGATDTTDVNVPTRLTLLVKRSTSASAPASDAGSQQAGWSIEINAYVVGIGMDATTAATDPRMLAAFEKMRQIYRQANIDISTIHFLDVPADAARRYALLDASEGPTSEVAALFQLSADRTERAINLFFVREISGEDPRSPTVRLGQAGGIPGPPGVHGTQQSGVVIATSLGSAAFSGDAIGAVMAHEVGHYIGLFHTTENLRMCAPGERPNETVQCTAFAEDVLSDTPVIDSDNLMYWAAGGQRLSEGQAYVMRRNPVVAP